MNGLVLEIQRSRNASNNKIIQVIRIYIAPAEIKLQQNALGCFI